MKSTAKVLERFVSRREFYRRVGRAWKRGYLLYGPPGTGKSSLIAAMSNYLKFNVYDMELSELQFNSEQRSLLLATANRSILVFEDIDCSFVVQDRKEATATVPGVKNAITLSGLLNFIDGLWSCTGDERIIIFTTNHKEKLDPALLRPGRMDMHIFMSYCTPCAFKTLAKSYLMIEKHHLFEEIEGCIVKAEVTPAEVAGELMKGDDPDTVLSGLVEFPHKKNIEHDQAKEKAAEEANRKAASEAAEEANRKAKEAAKEVEEANRKAKEAAIEVEETNRKAIEAADNEEKVKETQIKEKQNEGSRERKIATLIKRATIVIIVVLLVMILRGITNLFFK